MDRSRAWCFTSFKDSVYTKDGFVYLIYGREICEKTGRKHLQGYIEYKNGKTLKNVKRHLGDPAIHLERRKGTQAQAIEYCRKDGKVEEFGELRQSRPGSRSDLDCVRDVLKRGEGVRAVVRAGVGYQAIRYAQLCLTFEERVRSEPPMVRWYWGKTGTGKSRAAQAEAAEADPSDVPYWLSGGVRWMDGYDANTCVLFDDFRPEWCKLSILLRLLDRYPVRVECKGGSRSWLATNIWITCPKHPAECYLDQAEDIEQLLRRITEIKEFV